MRNLNMLAPTGFFLQERRFNVISNNLSNTQTTGYKKEVPVFQQLLSPARTDPKAVGYIDKASVDASVKVVLELH